MKVVIHTVYGYGPYKLRLLAEFHGYGSNFFINIDRHDPILVNIIETYPNDAFDFKVIEIPDNIDYTIINDDGMEHIAEKHRTWWTTYNSINWK